MNKPSQGDLKFEGIPVTLSRRTFIVPALSFKQLRVLTPSLQELMELQNSTPSELLSQLSVVSKLVHAAISRNYPDVSLDEVEDLLDFSNVKDALFQVLSISGLKKEQRDTNSESEGGSPLVGGASTPT